MDTETGTSVLSCCPDLPRHRWTVDDYHRMAEVGLLDPDARVELIEGEIVEMAPVGDAHIAISNRLTRLLVLAVGDRGVVSAGNPVRLNRLSEPQSDFTVLRPRVDYDTRRPHSEDVMLAVEVSDTTLRTDRRVRNARSMPAPGSPNTGSWTWKRDRSKSIGRPPATLTPRSNGRARATW